MLEVRECSFFGLMTFRPGEKPGSSFPAAARQMIQGQTGDKFAQTYVIKRDASPIGVGKLVYSVFDVWGWSLVFREVRRSIHSGGIQQHEIQLSELQSGREHR